MDSPPNHEGKDGEGRTGDLEPSAAGKFHNSPTALDIRHVKDAQSSTGSSYPTPSKKRQRKVGHLVGKDFTKAAWGQIAHEFAQETCQPYQLYQLQGKYIRLREVYRLVTEL
ncbi:uncharacterized protein LOC127263142 [Andrographis paniculata]|uniref:uncharacterized protein LOC127263142 n=1 Tax=Andrographis paniculata TaxID=175694 RepID=UPI0021E935C1|nr:uncharacterized protein LOC127263142 [Andrographis paniculata]